MSNKLIHRARNRDSDKRAEVYYDNISKEYVIKPNYNPKSWMYEDTEKEAIDTAEQVVGNIKEDVSE